MIGAENFPKVEVLISGGNNNNGRSSFLFVRYSSSPDGSNMTESPNISTEYIGISVSDSSEAPNDKSKYQWIKVKGDKGDTGEPGQDGMQGPPGHDGAHGIDASQTYVHIAYANDENGADFTTIAWNNHKYVGFYSGFEPREPNDYSQYKWIKISFSGGIPDAPSDNNKYVRENGEWSVLDFFLSSQGVQDLGTQNLNDLKTPGVYRQNKKENTRLDLNYPTENIRGGTLFVLPISENPLIIHQLFVFGGTSTSGENTVFYHEHPRIYMRKWVRSQKWSNWMEQTSTQRVLTATTNVFTTKTQFHEFTQDKATVILPTTAATITVEGNTRQQTTYIQSDDVATTFTEGEGVTIVGDKKYKGRKGAVIKLVIIGNTAYLSNGDMSDAPDTGKDYLRVNGAWKEFTGWQFRQLNDVEKLNDLKTPGLYGQYNSTAATVARNFPYDAIRGGHILVLPMTIHPSILTVFQVFFSAGTLNSAHYTNHSRIFMRAFVNNAQWLPWIEFNGGKVHTMIDATHNLVSAFQNKFPNNESTFILSKATTINVSNSYQVIRYVKNTSENITFSPVIGVNLIGDSVVTAPKGKLITLVCNGSEAFVCQ